MIISTPKPSPRALPTLRPIPPHRPESDPPTLSCNCIPRATLPQRSPSISSSSVSMRLSSELECVDTERACVRECWASFCVRMRTCA
ncbi:hypothetical protein C2E23DRAFT_831944 [Lenzites betulinus]|nr:hypothetical protein C2E23DRAFT_831944 [Lenzites betulinus]